MAMKKYYIGITDVGAQTVTITESGKRDWIHNGTIKCPPECGIYYRVHGGDENGKTTYKYGLVTLIDAENMQAVENGKVDGIKPIETGACYLLLGKEEEHSVGKESTSDWTAEKGYILTGRKHIGDENAITFMYSRPISVKRVVVLGKDETLPLQIESTCMVESKKESDGTEVKMLLGESAGLLSTNSFYLPITGRMHKGDENKKTITTFTKYYVQFDDGK